MNKQLTVTYTDAAKQRAEELACHYREVLQEVVTERKFVPGDNTVEITASDLEQATKYVQIRVQLSSVKRLKVRLLDLLAKVYIFMGVSVILLGIYYPQLVKLFYSLSPIQQSVVTLGIVSIFAGVISMTYVYLTNQVTTDHPDESFPYSRDSMR